MPTNDLTGRTFDRLTVVGRAEARPGAHTSFWVCRCRCGTVKTVSATALKQGYTRSCGCLHRERVRTCRHFNHRLYHVWQDMKQRCSNPNSQYYHRYGGRGISVCEEWADYDAFFRWAMKSGYQSGLTIDRIDNDGNYEPSNCRWATPMENTNNRANTRRVTFQGQTHTLTEWAEITGIPRRTIRYRYEAGKAPEDILNTVNRARRQAALCL